jgi:phosphatidylglycerol lysyltransferase
MRRTPDGMNGIMEFLIARCAEQFQQEGIRFMSLSAAPLAQEAANRDVSPNTATRMLGYIGSRLEPVYGFRSLLQFKKKFQPEFQPLYMAYPDPLALPSIGLALTRAYVPSLSVRQGIRFVRSLT